MKIDWQLLRFPFDDPKWQNKALIGVLLGIGSILLFPISLVLALPLSGYSLRLMRQVIKGDEPSMPEWDDWSELFTDGIKAWVVGFVYSLPMMIVTCCFYGSFFAIIPLIASAEDSPRMALAFAGGMVIFYILIFMLMAFMFALVVITTYFASVALTRLAATGSLGSAFEIGEVIRLGRKGFTNYLLAFVGLYGMLGILYLLVMAITYTIVLSCLAPILMGAMMLYGMVLSGALLGKAYFHTELTPTPIEGKLTPAPAETATLAEKPKKPRAAPKKKKEAE